jgi:hypothetical protein
LGFLVQGKGAAACVSEEFASRLREDVCMHLPTPDEVADVRDAEF